MFKPIPIQRLFIFLVLSIALPATAAPSGQFCLSNQLAKVARAVYHNISIGIRIQNDNGGTSVSAPDGGPKHMNWTSDDTCYPASQNKTLEIYQRTQEGEWALKRRFKTEWLNGIDLQFHKEGRWRGGQGYGINLSYLEGGQSKDSTNSKNPGANTWIGRLISQDPDIHFSDLCLPGSHVAGSYAQDGDSRSTPSLYPKGGVQFHKRLRSNKLIPKSQVNYLLSSWTQTQEESVQEQLSNGVRYLDMPLTLTSAPGSTEVIFVSAYYSIPLEMIFLQNNAF